MTCKECEAGVPFIPVDAAIEEGRALTLDEMRGRRWTECQAMDGYHGTQETDTEEDGDDEV